jgi:hypothetical protein
MKQRKPNTESTVGERLRLVVGGILAVSGVLVILVVGAMSNYSDNMVWLVGLGLIISGLLLANSMSLILAISSFFYR